MEKNLAKIFSVLFHPLLMTSLGLFILFNSGTALAVVQPEVKRISMIVVFLFTCVFPLGMIIMLYLSKMIQDLEISVRQDRVLPLALTIVLLLFTFFVMRGIPQLMSGHSAFLLSPAVGVFFILLINRFMKASMHMLGLGSVLGMMLIIMVFFRAQLQVIFVLLILITGITGTARLILEKHTYRELLTGFLTGFFTTAVLMIIFLR